MKTALAIAAYLTVVGTCIICGTNLVLTGHPVLGMMTILMATVFSLRINEGDEKNS